MPLEVVLSYIQANIHIAPYLIFSLLLLAGFGLPVSEDAMLFISALLAAQNPHYLVHFFVAVFMGAYLSDLICYYLLGRVLGHRIFSIKFFSKLISKTQIEKISLFYEKYGVSTLIFGRFIPFGVRNGLFFTAGLAKMNAIKFSLADLLACSISTTFFFTLYYNFGTTVVAYVKQANILIISLFALASLGFYVKKKKRSPKKIKIKQK